MLLFIKGSSPGAEPAAALAWLILFKMSLFWLRNIISPSVLLSVRHYITDMLGPL